MAASERELRGPVDLTRHAGRLNPEAVGWARRPVVRTHGLGRLRSKRWEHWGIVSPEVILGLTLVDLAYVRMAGIYLLDRASGAESTAQALLPKPSSMHLTAHCGTGTSSAAGGGVTMAFAEHASSTRLTATAPGLTVDLTVPVVADRDVLGVVIPWSDRRFQYSVKDLGRAVMGSVRAGEREFTLGGEESYAVLDHGRGQWPYRSGWTWAAAAGREGGRQLALNLGGGWTDGTGVTENGIFVDGVLHKIHGDLTWTFDRSDYERPWRIGGRGVDLEFTPVHERVDSTQLGIIASSIHQCFGTFTGTVRHPELGVLPIEGLTGWAEEAQHRW